MTWRHFRIFCTLTILVKFPPCVEKHVRALFRSPDGQYTGIFRIFQGSTRFLIFHPPIGLFHSVEKCFLTFLTRESHPNLFTRVLIGLDEYDVAEVIWLVKWIWGGEKRKMGRTRPSTRFFFFDSIRFGLTRWGEIGGVDASILPGLTRWPIALTRLGLGCLDFVVENLCYFFRLFR